MPSDRKKITIRLSDDDVTLLEEMSVQRGGITPTTLARIFVQDGLRGYSDQHDVLIGRLDHVSATLERINVLVASSIVAAAMLEADKIKPLEGEASEVFADRYRAALRKHINGAITTGTDLAGAFAGGKFKA